MSFRDLGPRNIRILHIDDAAISCLYGSVRPCAVRRGISKIVVKALYGQTIYVSRSDGPIVKLFELTPVFTYGNSSAAIVFVRFVSAPLHHVFPACMHFRAGHPVRCCPFLKRCSRRGASARKAFPAAEIGSSYRRNSTAVASAEPKRTATRRVSGLAVNMPPSKDVICKVDFAGIFCHA